MMLEDIFKYIMSGTALMVKGRIILMNFIGTSSITAASLYIEWNTNMTSKVVQRP